jgi:hypothetical protein
MPKSSTFANSEQMNLFIVCSISTTLIINFAIRNATIHRHFDENILRNIFAENSKNKYF